MKCPKCGCENKNSYLYCTECGNPLKNKTHHNYDNIKYFISKNKIFFDCRLCYFNNYTWNN